MRSVTLGKKEPLPPQVSAFRPRLDSTKIKIFSKKKKTVSKIAALLFHTASLRLVLNSASLKHH